MKTTSTRPSTTDHGSSPWRSASRVAASLPAVLLLAFALQGCGGGSEGSDFSSASSAAAPSCNYPDKFTASERTQASACGIQVSGAFGAADSRLQQIIQACQAGQKATADAEYAGSYTQLVQFARDNAKTLSCGGSSSTTLPNPSTQSYYNFCGRTSGSAKVGSCYGPVFRDNGGCGDASMTYIGQYSSLNACISARDAWLK